MDGQAPVLNLTVRLVCSSCRLPTTVLVTGLCPTCALLAPPARRTFEFVLITDPETKP